MSDRKTLLVILFTVLITVSAMAALVANRSRVTAVCKDLRVAMDGAIDATVESAPLTHQHSLTVFKHRTAGRARKEVLAVHSPLHHVREKGKEVFSDQGLKLVISKKQDPANGRFPASLDTTIDGKKVTLKLGCSL
jgi:hypothetical protein